MTAPKYDPDELAAHGLSEQDADEVLEGLEDIDAGRTVTLDAAAAEIREELEALAAIEARRARAKSVG